MIAIMMLACTSNNLKSETKGFILTGRFCIDRIFTCSFLFHRESKTEFQMESE